MRNVQNIKGIKYSGVEIFLTESEKKHHFETSAFDLIFPSTPLPTATQVIRIWNASDGLYWLFSEGNREALKRAP